MNKIDIFTDGSTLNNQYKGNRCGGCGVFFGDNDDRNLSIPLKETKNLKVTNQVAELTACVKALEKLDEDDIKKQITIYTDSVYVQNSMKKWAKNWIKNDWKGSTGKVVKNVELIKTLYQLTLKFNVNYIHVKAHKTEPSKDSKQYYYWYGNFMADKLAVEASNLIN